MTDSKTIKEGEALFSEHEKVVGQVTIDSGSIMFTDGIWDSGSIRPSHKLRLDLGEEAPLRLPVTTLLQNGKRYILIDVDAATRVNTVDGEVDVDGKIEIPEEPEEKHED